MTLDDAPPRPLDDTASTRRSRRHRGLGTAPVTTDPTDPDAGPTAAAVAEPAEASAPITTARTQNRRAVRRKKADAAPRTALGWVEDHTVTGIVEPSAVAVYAYPDLLADAPRRSPLRPGVLVPLGILLALVAAYCATTLLWPLHALAPRIDAVRVDSAAAPAAAPAWPAQGSAAISVEGIGAVASSPDPAQIASITKVVTALLVLDAQPLAVGQSGPEFRFTSSDSDDYWNYLRDDESALDVPAGGTLSELQLLEGMLIGSANNYADRLAGNLWPNDRVYASAAAKWLSAHGISGVTIVDPSGIEAGNTATPDALLRLAALALDNPVIAQIVATKQIELPGAGLVENTNKLLADPGVVGVKTGSLDSFNLLSAKDVVIGDTTVRLYASVLGQVDDAARVGASRALYAQLEGELQPTTAIASGTVVGMVQTRWGATAKVVADSDARVILWNGGTGTVSTTFDLGDSRAVNDTVGSLTVAGPLDRTSVQLRLADDIEGPSAWWRLTHPLDLFGLDG